MEYRASSPGNGNKAVSSSNSSDIVKDKCRDITIGDYMRVVVYNDMSVLIKDGEPSEDQLRNAKIEILTEYSELSGDSDRGGVNNTIRNIMKYESAIMGIKSAAQVMYIDFDKSTELLKMYGLRFRDDDSGARLKRIEAEIKRLSVQLEMEKKLLEKLSEKNDKGEKLTESMFLDEVVAVSIHAKHTLNFDTNLAMYAAYRKNLVNHLKSLDNVNRKQNARSAGRT